MKLCGHTSPGLIVTNSNTVTLEYQTDTDGLSNGWSLTYSTHSERLRGRNGTREMDHEQLYSLHTFFMIMFVPACLYFRSAVSISW